MFGIIVFFLGISHVENVIIKLLNKDCEWTFKNYYSGRREVIATDFPRGIYSDLKENEYKAYIEDVFFGFNDKKYLPVTKSFTHYFCNFKVDDYSRHNMSNAELVFDGIDGTASILFNHEKIGEVSNTFIRYRFDITKQLNKKNNVISFQFDSPTYQASLLSKKFERYESLRSRNKFTEKNVHFLRRMQASFGTEWAPAIPSVGIWRNVELIIYEKDLVIRNITVTTHTTPDRYWKVEIVVHCDVPYLYVTPGSSNSSQVLSGTIRATFFADNGEAITGQVNFQRFSVLGNTITNSVILRVSQSRVKRWWPNGYGVQQLYPLEVSFTNSYYSQRRIISKTIQFGFRTIEINQDEIHLASSSRSEGMVQKYDNFHFVVNDLPIFAKGASFLPTSILPEKSSDETKINYLLESVKMAHMNMLRVPASGIYQSDYFYEACDQHGILIWQEMMLDKEMYPFAVEEFTQTLTQEINQQFQRLQYHPSIAVWVSNNEIQATLSDLEDEYIDEDWNEEYKEFLKIFIDIVKNDKSRPYLTSTPSNKFVNVESININDNHNSYQSGDVHIDTISDSWLIDENNDLPRFVTEYGVWSLPSYQSLLSQATAESDLASVNTKFMQHRQRRDDGDAYSKIISSVSKHFGYPKTNHLDAFIYASQINQAWSMKLQTEHFRAHKSKEFGSSMGALYWHLNDVWHAPSASSIEFNGKWKMLHYYARKFFAPIASSIEISGPEKIAIYLISDYTNNVKVNLKFEIFDWSMLQPIYTFTVGSIVLEKLSSTNLEHFDIDIDIWKLLKSHCNETQIGQKCLFKLTIYNYETKEELHTNYLLPSKISLFDIDSLPNPKIRVEPINCTIDGKCTIKIRTNFIALFVWLEADNIAGYFSDNGFIMTEPEKEIIFYIKERQIVQTFVNSLKHKVIGKDYLRENFNKSRSWFVNFWYNL